MYMYMCVYSVLIFIELYVDAAGAGSAAAGAGAPGGRDDAQRRGRRACRPGRLHPVTAGLTQTTGTPQPSRQLCAATVQLRVDLLVSCPCSYRMHMY